MVVATNGHAIVIYNNRVTRLKLDDAFGDEPIELRADLVIIYIEWHCKRFDVGGFKGMCRRE